jgi:transglutaminase/protease-like cytokinesis protein 3
MKKIILLFLFISYNVSSQNLFKVDQIIKSYPEINSIEELANKINYDFKTDLEKAKAIYSWLAINIKYYKARKTVLESPEIIYYTSKVDLAYRTEGIKRRKNEKIILETFETKKAVCEGYALTFKRLCDLLNIENELIKGYVKNNTNEIGKLAKNKNHVWNAIKINNKWLFLDVTFGSGYSLDGKWKTKLDPYYFNINKDQLNFTHYASEQKWLNFTNQKPLKQFCNEPIFNTVFLSSNAKLLSHKVGEINIKRKEKIQLKLKDLKPNTMVLYSYNRKKEAKKPAIYSYDSYTEIVIKSPSKNSDLNIYFDKKLALQYKIVIQ